jgi:serine/threonine protein kinase
MSYATPIDIWSCGCIFAELFIRKPLFPGKYELDQLSKIFDIIGIPEEEEWPSLTAIKRSSFRSSGPVPWNEVVPEMDPPATDLISVKYFFLSYIKSRITKIFFPCSEIAHI